MNQECLAINRRKKLIEKNKERGSAFLLTLIAVMVLAVLTAVIITSIKTIRESKNDFVRKAQVRYLAESANALARSALLDYKRVRQWKNISEQNLEGGVISARITSLDNHLWQIDSTAEDITRTFKVEITNIVRPDFEYALITSKLSSKNEPDELTIYGTMFSKEYDLQKKITYYPSLAENVPLYETEQTVALHPETKSETTEEAPAPNIPTLNRAQYSSLLPFPSGTTHIINDEIILDGKTNEIKHGIYLVSNNITLKNISINASFISLNGTIIIGENCSISSFNNYPAIASLQGDIIIRGNDKPVFIEGLLYGSNILIESSVTLRGAIYSPGNIVFQRKRGISKFAVAIHFNENILQTKGLLYRWDKLRNISWKSQ
ncbi:MAG: hypothetical protein A2Y62_17965 [Candidatus Fischerbacteria bacterium RBG_13_37_8]|uniref:Uncharacterized protein n=1 Tax=Candidatus Fischerbacteria bacterium RBG_13_37_8 TaxID=1817863 RepID=A0A1F5VUA0_9BACT|nr:MAG: hypothetical protein A2Y62_17965 [Candidatus Fischerbacteria bacterium RBG_13_37_8]